jgi:hypothetical protein
MAGGGNELDVPSGGSEFVTGERATGAGAAGDNEPDAGGNELEVPSRPPAPLREGGVDMRGGRPEWPGGASEMKRTGRCTTT